MQGFFTYLQQNPYLLLFFVEIKFHVGGLALPSYSQTTGKSACRY